MLKRLGFLIILVWVAIMPVAAFASNYDVTAVVHAPLPPDLPIVTGPKNTTLQNSGVFITGTCTVVVPTIVVILIRDNQTIGSANCRSDGTFSIFVGLVLGQNIIYPKFLTITGLYSGYGVPIYINYSPTNPAATESPLKLGFDYDFVSYDDLKTTQLKYTISGGKAPYEVIINWGDNSQKKYQVKTSGEQSIEHKYKTILPATQISIQVVDAEGTKTIQSRSLISFRSGVYVPASAPVGESKKNWIQVWFVGVASFGAILLLNHYKQLRIKPKTKSKKVNSPTKR